VKRRLLPSRNAHRPTQMASGLWSDVPRESAHQPAEILGTLLSWYGSVRAASVVSHRCNVIALGCTRMVPAGRARERVRLWNPGST